MKHSSCEIRLNKSSFRLFRGIHPQYPPMYSHPGLPALERERLGLPPGPQHGLDPNEQMVSCFLLTPLHRHGLQLSIIIVSLFRSSSLHFCFSISESFIRLELSKQLTDDSLRTIHHLPFCNFHFSIIFTCKTSHNFLFFPYVFFCL